jgi:hypothetical protein
MVSASPNLLSAKLVDGRDIEFEDNPFSEGGEKKVFWAKGRTEVVQFFRSELGDRLGRRRRLDNILGPYNPLIDPLTKAFWTKHFCWPTGIVDGLGKLPADFAHRHSLANPPLAVVCPSYGGNYFFRNKFGVLSEKEGKWFTLAKPRQLVPTDELGNNNTLVNVCLRMARAIRRLHFAGLAHSDLSNKNVLVDPKSGEACVIDIDSLVVPTIAPPSVDGTPGYIAPEVVAGRAHPSIATDRHALAVLIYELLLQRHPLRGSRFLSRDVDEEERLMMGERAVFIEDPNDRSNRLSPKPHITIDDLGPYLKPLFLETFVRGLKNPQARASTADWETALIKTLQCMYPSPRAGQWFFLPPGGTKRCPFTGAVVHEPILFAHLYREAKPGNFISERHSLTIHHNMPIFDWHLFWDVMPNERSDRTRRGYFSNDRGRWFLVNETAQDMKIINGTAVRSGQAAELKTGTQLRFSLQSNGRLAVFKFL